MADISSSACAHIIGSQVPRNARASRNEPTAHLQLQVLQLQLLSCTRIKINTIIDYTTKYMQNLAKSVEKNGTYSIYIHP